MICNGLMTYLLKIKVKIMEKENTYMRLHDSITDKTIEIWKACVDQNTSKVISILKEYDKGLVEINFNHTKSKQGGTTLLMLLMRYDFITRDFLIKLIENNKIDYNNQQLNEYTFLMYIVKFRDFDVDSKYEIITKLIGKEIDFDKKQDVFMSKNTALTMACEIYRPNIIDERIINLLISQTKKFEKKDIQCINL